MSFQETFRYGIDRLTPGTAIDIALGKTKGLLAAQASKKIENSFIRVKSLSEGDVPVYGVNTGFGPLCTTRISPGDTRTLQANILKSHSCGVGEAIDPIIAKLMLILKAHALSFGYSGVSPQTVERIIWHIDNDIIPVVPSQGSVGASGDLAPLAHLFLPLIGLGAISRNGSILSTAEALAEQSVKPISLGPKEGLALINGTQFMAAHAVWGLFRMQRALDLADIAGAMTVDALLGSVRPFSQALHALRPHPGQLLVAQRLRAVLSDSEMVASHRLCAKVQDPYSLRCIPQIHGASRNAWLHLKDIIQTEINSVTDNPVILDNGETISGGHFHGQPIALPLDYATLAASELGNVSDRRMYLLLGGEGKQLPKFLIRDSGLHSGFMILQYTSAALASENKNLCMPASADSIPTSLGQEDHVSMGSISSRKLNKVLDNLEQILAIELMSSAQALDFRKPLKSSPLIECIRQKIRAHIEHADADRVFSQDIRTLHGLIARNELTEYILEKTKQLGLDLDGEFQKEFSL